MPDPHGLPLAPGAEFALIRRFVPRGQPARADVLVGPGDDCAVVAGGIALSTDMSVEGVHFRRDWLSPREIGWRAAAAALSDLAAVAARPIGVLVSLALPAGDAGDPAVELMAGVREAAEAVGGAVLGGDVARTTGPLVVDVTVVGEARNPVLRSGARRGDEVWVTGALGGAAAAVRAWLAGGEPDGEASASRAPGRACARRAGYWRTPPPPPWWTSPTGSRETPRTCPWRAARRCSSPRR
ncbi:MAG TPA: AIR synthase related protein [Longimicrobiaceae bacterium]|nr:AIR synthase related protein [Longimicrobiaceae bacterium]